MILDDEDSTHGGTLINNHPDLMGKIKKPNIVYDIWSLGICLFELHEGHHPFEATNGQFELSLKHNTWLPKLSRQNELSTILSDFLEKSMNRQQQDLITLDFIGNHPYIKNSFETESAGRQWLCDILRQ
ncbi:hypothetical protein GCK72_021789 [Caenorhabditis remanei]|uniref:Protein kinase domain-containing protein n=1 Tax=Caenorhabditis remanei TaxID=31234 RepID=A0A6A5GJ24_CAERE|nr:hypothetical protein GCK72_021789 [Caenorhabditis remanei]KAF1755220.1 hypothetical protein GCK72_021789 [Caenorhabditis remanei]